MALGQPVVTSSAPEAAPVQEPAPVPQEDAVVKVEDERETVKIADLIPKKKAADSKDGSDTPKDQDKPADQPSPTPEPVKEDKKPDPAPPQSQKDIDAAIGKRLAAAEKKWTEKNAPLLRLAQLVQDANPDMSMEQIVSKFTEDRNTALGMSPQLAGLLEKRGLLGEVKPVEAEAASYTEEEQTEAADRLGAQADTISKLAPDFNLKDFLGQNADRMDALMRGEVTLTGLYYEKNIDTLLKSAREQGYADGQKAAVDNIRNRNDKVPSPPTPSAPGDTVTDFSKMSDKQFDEYNAQIEKALREGKRVTF